MRVLKYVQLRPPQNTPARIAQDPKVHLDLEGVTHHPWVNSFRHYYKLSCSYQVKISKFSFAVSAGETAFGAFELAAGIATANPVLAALGTATMIRGAWGLAANPVCGVNAKLAYDSIHYTQMAERLYNRKIQIYRDIIKNPDFAMPINTVGADNPQLQSDDRRRHYDFLIDSVFFDTLLPEEKEFLNNKDLRRIYYDHFENRRDVVLCDAATYQLGVLPYAALSGATPLLYAYPARAVFTSMVYWHFKREEKRAQGKTVFGGKRTAPYIDKALSIAAHKPATLSIPFEVAAGANYGYMALADLGLAGFAFATGRRIDCVLHILSAAGNAGFMFTSGLSIVAELEQGDGKDWKPKDGEHPAKHHYSVWRSKIPSPILRRAVNYYLPQVPVDHTLYARKNNLPAAVM